MIDQLVSGQPQASQPAKAAYHNQKGNAQGERDNPSDAFEDLISKAGQPKSRQERLQPEDEDAPVGKGKTVRLPEALPKAAFDLTAAARDLASSADSRIRVAHVKEDPNAVNRRGQPAGRLEAASTRMTGTGGETDRIKEGHQPAGDLDAQLAKLIGTIGEADETGQADQPAEGLDAQLAKLTGTIGEADQAGQARQPAEGLDAQRAKGRGVVRETASEAGRIGEDHQADKVRRTRHAAEARQPVAGDRDIDASPALSSTDELGLLLGLSTVKETDTRSGRKSGISDKDDADDKGSDAMTPEPLPAKAETLHAGHPILGPGENRQGMDAVHDDASPSSTDGVRFVSADGRGRPVDMPVDKNAAEQSRSADKPANDLRLDTATVLEARRYLGFSIDGNATALANAAKADPTWSTALQAAQRPDPGTLGNTVTEVNTLKLQMNPENLGNMVASLKLKGDALTVELRVESIEAYRHLSADHDDIVKALQDQGFSIDKVTVQLNATDRTDTGADRDMARQGQAQREGQAQRDGQGGQPGRNDGRPDERSHRAGIRDMADAASDDRGTDGGRPGNIYL